MNRKPAAPGFTSKMTIPVSPIFIGGTLYVFFKLTIRCYGL